MPRLAAPFAAAKLKKPLHLAFSHDEEVGCIGVRSLIEDLANLPAIPEMCIVGEPTLMHPMLAHKGKINVRGRVKGFECHSSLAPDGVNAIEYAAELIAFLKDMARRKSKEGPFDTMFDIAHTTGPYRPDRGRHRPQHRAAGLHLRL